MDNWENSLRGDRSRSNSRKNPSFSSTLLDAIYRSIDDGEPGAGELVAYKETMRKKPSRSSNNDAIMKEYGERERRSYHRTEKWAEKVSVKVSTLHRASDYDSFHLKQNPVTFHSTSSSSESSYGGFSSSEAESVYGGRASVLTAQRPKPVRTSPAPIRTEPPRPKKAQTLEKSMPRSSLLSCSELKKVKKLPVSPGAKLASFLNSLFAATGSAKKAKLSSSFNGDDDRSERKSKSTQASSTCSTASSYSRSCLSKTPSSRGKSINGVKRSVRFYPVSVIVDEDCRPCGQKSLHEEKRSLTAVRETGDSAPRFIGEELKFHLMEKNRRVEEAAKKFLNGYQTKGDFPMRDLRMDEVDDADDDDDAASDSSSDLFELENLTAIGIERYREELPVYETTHFDTNRAIANGLIL
ncbi:protein BIG GRAIN 1-like A [Aristolochia californica]|uniref:protein BIG GRAIN 1-like A n=1 Tax=Aristolochia californica TaxID=171875 RepID=UPI0035DDBB03